MDYKFMPRKLDDEQLDKEVLHFLSKCVGKEHALDRWLLVVNIYGVMVPLAERNDDNPLDREIRYAVARLREQGHLICDLGNGKGRYMAANEAEFWEMYAYYAKPIQKRAETLKAMKKAAAQKWPNMLQPSLFNFEEEIA